LLEFEVALRTLSEQVKNGPVERGGVDGFSYFSLISGLMYYFRNGGAK
jgi:hypothetical protein